MSSQQAGLSEEIEAAAGASTLLELMRYAVVLAEDAGELEMAAAIGQALKACAAIHGERRLSLLSGEGAQRQ